MSNQKIPLIIGNWKMNPETSSAAISLAKVLATKTKKITSANVVVMPPMLYVSELSKILNKSNLKLGVQHTHPGPVGAFTGEVSPLMCQHYGVSHSLVGHSERRARGESDSMVNDAVKMLLKQKMTPVLCVGEKIRDAQALYLGEIEQQIVNALALVPTSRYKDLVIAYEPVWAIGTGLTATSRDVEEMVLFIKKVLTKLAGRAGAMGVKVLYGGSVNGENAAILYKEGAVDGFLVGGASLKAEEFMKIINATTQD